jgi:AcrR family transcriptional regulator
MYWPGRACVKIHRTVMSREGVSTRPYRKRARADQEERTRRRIAQAAMELHGTVGPARTTISAVAERAGVQRATVYRHFPDEASLFGACSAHWASLHPPPDPAAWVEIDDPDERLRTALADLYRWYGCDEQMFVNTYRDAELVPALRAIAEAEQRQFEDLVAVICAGRAERGRARRRVLAATAHAASFATWHSLTRHGGLSDGEAIDLAAAMVTAAAR